jgi:hypothetical protein
MFWLLIGLVQAAELRSGDELVVDEPIDDDLYVSGNVVEVRSDVTGDVVAAGGRVIVTGSVDGDVIAAGGTVEVRGPVQGSVRAAGGNVLLGGPIADDAVVAGANLLLLPGGDVGRDALMAGNSATVQGDVGRRLRAAGGAVTLQGAVGDEVQADAGKLQIGPDASIRGPITYESGEEAIVAPTAQLGGPIERTEPPRQDAIGSGLAVLVRWVRGVVGLFAAGLLLLLVVPRVLGRTATELWANPGRSAGYGFLGLFALPAVALVVFGVGLLVGGWWIGGALLAVLALALIVGFEASGLALGSRLVAWSGRPPGSPVWALLVGLAVLVGVGFIPLIGAIVVLLAALIGLGGLLVSGYRERQLTRSALPAGSGG